MIENNDDTNIELFKNIVKSKQNINAITEALKGAFDVNPNAAIKWYKEISALPEPPGGFYFQNTLFDLLSKIVEIDKQAASQIFYNMLLPQFIETPTVFESEKPRRTPNRDTMDLWRANEVIPKLFEKAPKEFVKTAHDLVLIYRDIPKQPQKIGIQDSYSSIWYHDEAIYPEVKLLKTVENIACNWSEKDIPKVDEVINVLDKESYSISKLVLIKILLANPKRNKQKLFEIVQSDTILTTYDILHLLPKILTVLYSHLTDKEIEKLNEVLMIFSFPKEFRPEKENEYRKYLLSAIPTAFRNDDVKNRLSELDDIRILRPRGESSGPMVFSSIENEKQEEEKFEELSDQEQQKEIVRLISIFPQLATKNEKLDFLKNIQVFLNKDKEKINQEILAKLKPLINSLCYDSDPEDDTDLTNNEIGSSLISYPTIRANAASCQLLLTWHDPSQVNLELCSKLAEDKTTQVREGVARNLRYLSVVDFDRSYEIATKFKNDNRRLLFFLADYTKFILPKHLDESFEISNFIIEKMGKDELKHEQDFVLDFFVSLVIFMALKHKKEKFTELFEKLLMDNSYNYTVKHTIAFTCKDNEILFDDSLRKKVIDIYSILLDNENKKIRNDADFFLLYTLTKEKKSLLPDIKPLLEKMSKMKYETSGDDFMRMNIINYIEAFWKDFPNDSVNYIHQIYDNNPSLAYSFHRGRDIIKVLDVMFESKMFSEDLRKKLIDVLMKFVKAGWPEANAVLKKLENS